MNLPDWNEGLPNYTQEEIAAIERRLSQFQQMASGELGGEAKFHPEAVPKLQRILAGEALAEFARDKLVFHSEDIPTDWRPLALDNLDDALKEVIGEREVQYTYSIRSSVEEEKRR